MNPQENKRQRRWRDLEIKGKTLSINRQKTCTVLLTALLTAHGHSMEENQSHFIFMDAGTLTE